MYNEFKVSIGNLISLYLKIECKKLKMFSNRI